LTIPAIRVRPATPDTIRAVPRSALPIGLPRAGPFDGFVADPLNFLTQARATHGDLFALRESGAIFSRADDSAGVVAAFGLDHQRAVLTDLDTFGMPVSAAHRLNLPPNLVILNRGLHSLTGSQHTTHKRSLATLLSECAGDEFDAVAAAVDEVADRWRVGSTVHLLGEMRALALSMARRLLFGARADESAGLAQRLRAYFELRREASSPANPVGTAAVDALTRLGNAVDAELRAYVRTCRSTRARDGIVGRLACAEDAGGALLSEDDVIGHANVLFVSSTEPVAVTLTWIFVILSQLPELRGALRTEWTRARRATNSPVHARGGLALLDRVVDETLRILPPNAFMVRTTTRTAVLGGMALPANCEIVLCPFVSHRDPRYFPQPGHFMPDRWQNIQPSPFVYFPFGAGGHSCVGRALALSAIRAAVSRLLARYDLVLAGADELDWRLHIIFMPRADPRFAIRSASAPPERGGPLRGPVAALLQLDI
jgi:cytochrome P450